MATQNFKWMKIEIDLIYRFKGHHVNYGIRVNLQYHLPKFDQIADLLIERHIRPEWETINASG